MKNAKCLETGKTYKTKEGVSLYCLAALKYEAVIVNTKTGYTMIVHGTEMDPETEAVSWEYSADGFFGPLPRTNKGIGEERSRELLGNVIDYLLVGSSRSSVKRELMGGIGFTAEELKELGFDEE